MRDKRSRVTVVGVNKRVDLALPSDTPIGEYVAQLADLCGQIGGGLLPPVWTLGMPGQEPLPVVSSLAEAGVIDGQVLYLRNVAQDPSAGPVVEDIDERVAEEAAQQRRKSLPKGVLVLSIGLAWLAVTAVAVTMRHHGGSLGSAVILLAAGLLAVGAAWALHQGKAGVPQPLCLAISLIAVPCVAGAGALLGQTLGGRDLFWGGAVVGANLATLMALAATPEAAIFALELPLAAGALLAVALIAVSADAMRTAAGVTVTALALVAAAKPISGTIAAWSTWAPRDGASLAQATTGMLLRARQVLAVTLAAPALALAIALPALALSGQPYPLALASVAGVALLVRARQAGFTGEAVLVAGAGSIGVFAVLTEVADRFLDRGMVALALTTLGVGIAAVGVVITMLRRADAEAGTVNMLGSRIPRRDRGRFIDIIGMLCMIAAASLAMGVFGVLADLFSMGRGIVG